MALVYQTAEVVVTEVRPSLSCLLYCSGFIVASKLVGPSRCHGWRCGRLDYADFGHGRGGEPLATHYARFQLSGALVQLLLRPGQQGPGAAHAR